MTENWLAPGLWDRDRVQQALEAGGETVTVRTLERRLETFSFLSPPLTAEVIEDERGRPASQLVLGALRERAQRRRDRVLFACLRQGPAGEAVLVLNDGRGARFWMAQAAPATQAWVVACLSDFRAHFAKSLLVVPHGALVGLLRTAEATAGVELALSAHAPVLQFPEPAVDRPAPTPHLQALEAEAIHIIREAVAQADKPGMLFSVGKDSAVMLHLARKAFYPAPPPFPLLHVDTRWKFQEMYLFRAHMAEVSGMELLVHTNPEAIAKNINPFDHGSALHTDITKTQGLKQALDQYRFDVVFGGARRDEEKSRAKERIFSFRTTTHTWDPKSQRPELWNLYNAQKRPGESIRVFPISNWTEVDIWQYIYQEQIPIVPLYFAKERPVVERDGLILMVDDDRFRLAPDEEIQFRSVRFRTLGCYPLTGGVESDAQTLPDIIVELIQSRSSERQGRAIDSDSAASMEKKKQEGYF
ncbi:MAG: sulfate adenylyltransferase subunit CysD [Pseudomonadales bacterium]|nr:sulfate adenylyltransferase subunit CysD [Pseudomonadales bacterium]